ncbi:hypothetical protein [Rickettsiella massiliensis]|uniref:hypothetical protein n=1 Tax=Rickettsiella massiliensis TaxID=676517 RepID=UPI00029A132F|nr:hypothetical protein [Rickettsiella massiliensis]
MLNIDQSGKFDDIFNDDLEACHDKNSHLEIENSRLKRNIYDCSKEKNLLIIKQNNLEAKLLQINELEKKLDIANQKNNDYEKQRQKLENDLNNIQYKIQGEIDKNLMLNKLVNELTEKNNKFIKDRKSLEKDLVNFEKKFNIILTKKMI